MDKFLIKGGKKLEGTVDISGAKNSALPVMAASLLSPGKIVLENIPDVRDVRTMTELLNHLGAGAERHDSGEIAIDGSGLERSTAPYELVKTMRASVCVLGPLLARTGYARVSYPGGCVIGPRPIDLHLKGLSALGAEITVEHGFVTARAGKLKGARIDMGGPTGPTVLGTANVMTAAVLAEGEIVIENAAREPEISDLAGFLSTMGARIEGAGTGRVRIYGVDELHDAEYRIISDRIEAGTYMAAAAVTGGDVFLRGAVCGHMEAVIDKFRKAGVSLDCDDEGIRISGNCLSPVDVETAPYPGFPTDMQAQLMALMLRAPGESVISENIYPDRFMHVGELERMGADIVMESSRAIIRGGHPLGGAKVMASDLRASAALVIAGLAAEGETEIARVYHLDRGYERMERKLELLGAEIKRVKSKKQP